MSSRRHGMPFGAQLEPDGRVRFRLWAPAARRLELLLASSPAAGERPSSPCREDDVAPGRQATATSWKTLPMTALPQGWFELVTDAAQSGSLYRFRVDGAREFPDPAARRNPRGVHGASQVVDPLDFEWDDGRWRGRPWHEAVVYELHVGTFSPEGTFAGVEGRLDHLQRLGITAIELMPVAAFPGARGWGYDGVLPFAPAACYGTPEELKSLVAAAHRRGLAIMLDVVYNHLGPEGNYLGLYAPQFFSDRHHTPWGAAINFDGEGSRTVRDFFIHNALYWLEEYRFDGLRFDAVHTICDDSPVHILTEIAAAARALVGGERHCYLVLENGANQARFLGPPGGAHTFDAQWDDDVHHCLHTILSGESDGYYADYAGQPHALLCRGLAQGFAYQGEFSQHEGTPRGEPSAHLPPTAFVLFLQNHDQIGNRALGERLGRLVRQPEALRAATAVVLLAPSPPLLFMGEEWNAPEPFPYFCDFEPELAEKVRAGRQREFARFERFRGAGADLVPDPTSATTFASARLDWKQLTVPAHSQWLDDCRRLLVVRQRDIVPIIPLIRSAACIELEANGAFAVDWVLADGSVLHLLANLSAEPVRVIGRAHGRMIFATHPNIRAALSRDELAPWSVMWLLEHGLAGS